MKAWTTTYRDELVTRFNELRRCLPAQLREVPEGRAAPALGDLAIGSARKRDAAVLFFDIEGFSKRTGSADDAELRRTLAMLNCAIPMVMRVVYDHRGFIEKNTGDGIMAIFAEGSPEDIATDALDAAVTIFHVMREMVNPHLESIGIARVDARIGIDYGNILISKMGVPTGSAANQRNFLVAIGPTANIACRLQELAGTNEIFVGHNVYRNAGEWRRARSMTAATPPNWDWIYLSTRDTYWVWRLTEVRGLPFSFASLLGYGRAAALGRPSTTVTAGLGPSDALRRSLGLEPVPGRR